MIKKKNLKLPETAEKIISRPHPERYFEQKVFGEHNRHIIQFEKTPKEAKLEEHLQLSIEQFNKKFQPPLPSDFEGPTISRKQSNNPGKVHKTNSKQAEDHSIRQNESGPSEVRGRGRGRR